MPATIADRSGTDPFDLGRFVAAQAGGAHEQAAAEVARGRKTGHWMWFVFPQARGLGSSPMAVRYGIGSTAEAVAYLRHPLLGPRLTAISGSLLGLGPEVTAEQVFGGIDAIKLRSSMTLFAVSDPGEPIFAAVLDRFHGGVRDPATLRLLSG